MVGSDRTTKILLGIVVVALLTCIGGMAYVIYIQKYQQPYPTGSVSPANLPKGVPPVVSPTPQPSSVQTYTNKEQGYSFEYPTQWNVTMNTAGDSKHVLFGPNTTVDSSLGGIEIGTFKSIDEMLKATDSELVDKRDITIDGTPALRAHLVNVVSSEDVLFVRDGVLWNFYIHSQDTHDIASFDQLVKSVKFLPKDEQ